MLDETFPHRLLARLPAPSRAKVEHLVDERSAAWAAAVAAENDLSETRSALNHLEAAVKAKLAEVRRITPEDRERITGILPPKREELARRLDARDRAVGRFRGFDFLADCAAWLDGKDGRGPFRHHAVTAPKAGDPLTAVGKLRRELERLDMEIQATRRLPEPVADIRERTLAALDDIAARGRIEIDPRRERDPARLADNLSLAVVGGSLRGDPVAALVWCCRDVIAEKLLAEIGSKDAPGALSAADRRKRVAEIAARRLEAERREEAVIAAAETAGQFITRRRAADPRAILEIHA